MAYGRGGAGNILAATTSSSTPNPTSTPDPEKSSQTTSPYINTDPGHDFSTKENAEYAHYGRGGAGNYYSPRDLAAKGKFEGAGTSHVVGDGTPAPLAGDGSTKGGGQEGAAVSEVGVGAGAVGAAGAGKEEKTTATKGPAYRGRGGAGNFAFGVSESEERKGGKRLEEEEREKERLRGEIEKDVEEGLARPERAITTGKEEEALGLPVEYI